MSSDLLDLLYRGDFAATLALLRPHPDVGAGVLRRIRSMRREMQAVPVGQRGPSWLGELTEGHHDAVMLALLAALPAKEAAGLGAVSRRAAEALPHVVPDDLPVFVETWSRLFQRNPKNWDRNSHDPVMFSWVERGQVPAPTGDGAVNRPGLGAAALDHQSGDPIIGLMVHLVDTEVWDRASTLTRVDAALASPGCASSVQQRWLRKAAAALA